jgi:uncharacterized protein (TIGR03086 family)
MDHADDAPYLVGVPEAGWAERAAQQGAVTARAWADPHAWEGETTFGGGAMPAAAVGSMMTAEFAVHAWDVAVATGQRMDVPEGLGETVAAGRHRDRADGPRGGWFGAEVDVADGPAFARALGASGRDPNWTL